MSTKLILTYLNAKMKIVDFLKREKGGSEIIAMVLIIAIVLVLAGIFWNKLYEFFNGLWDKVIGKDPTDTITK